MIARRHLMAGAGAAMLLPSATWAAAARQGDPVAPTRYGRVRGVRDQGVLVFRGIRYGADTAPRRFQPALAPTPWRGIADATAYGAAAPQTKAAEPTSEDCLFLNIWTPALDRGRRPVMVYLHGGAHAHGSPPNAAILSRTPWSARTMSRLPTLPDSAGPPSWAR